MWWRWLGLMRHAGGGTDNAAGCGFGEPVADGRITSQTMLGLSASPIVRAQKVDGSSTPSDVSSEHHSGSQSFCAIVACVRKSYSTAMWICFPLLQRLLAFWQRTKTSTNPSMRIDAK